MDTTKMHSSGPDVKETVAPTPPSPIKPAPSLDLGKNISKIMACLLKINGSSGGLDKSVKLATYTLSFLSAFSPLLRSDPLNQTSTSLQALSSQFSFHRYILRLITGIPLTYEGISNNSWVQGSTKLPDGSESECTNEFVKGVDVSLVRSMAFYYPIEHVAFLYWAAPLLFKPPSSSFSTPSDAGIMYKLGLRNSSSFSTGIFSPDVGNALSAASCVAWLWYIVGDAIVQGEKVHRLSGEMSKYYASKADTDNDKDVDKDANANDEDEDKVKPLKEDLLNAKMMLARELLYILPALHWCNPNYAKQPLLGTKAIECMMFSEAVITYWQAWRSAF